VIAKKKEKQLQKTGKSAIAINQLKKKAPCHDTVRLRLGWSLLDVVATW
jgi:hypothetical protein